MRREVRTSAKALAAQVLLSLFGPPSCPLLPCQRTQPYWNLINPVLHPVNSKSSPTDVCLVEGHDAGGVQGAALIRGLAGDRKAQRDVCH